jgi:tyrosine-protein kinase
VTPTPVESGLDHYLRVMKHGLWIIVLTVALTMLAALFISLREAKLYQSSADVFLGTPNFAATLSNVQLPAQDPVRQAATQADLARTPSVAARALSLTHLSDRSPGALLSSSSVSSDPNADILTFTVKDRRPRVAERLAGAYATAYTQYRRRLDTLSIGRARTQIAKRIAELRASGEQGSTAYDNLIQKDQDLSTLAALQGSNALLVRSASAAAQIQPKPVRNGILAAVLGLVLGVGLVFLRDALNTRVRTAAEVQDGLDLPLLGRVPEPPRRLRLKNQLVMLTGPQSPEAEAFRILATNLELVNLEPRRRTIMFTSALRGEGKSTTVANLGVTFARAGRRVVLVDLDLRMPSLAGFFEIDENKGLTNVALGYAQLGDVLERVPILNDTGAEERRSGNGTVQGILEVLPVGPRPPNPAEFVGSHILAELLTELQERADLVLLDSPPILHLSDSMILASRAEGIVVVTQLSMIRRPVLQELHRVLAAAPAAKLGFVLTGAAAGDTYSYGYGHTYEDRRASVAQRETV